MIAFRLTDEEERRLDELVDERGHKDRSSLLRSWLAEKPKSKDMQFTADEERRLDEVVAERGFANREALFRAWLDEKKPVPEVILGRCMPWAQTVFAFIVDEAKQHDYRILWKSFGFWVHARNFAWTMTCDVPNLIRIDFRADAQDLRHEELATGLWGWDGVDSLQVEITDSNVQRVRERMVRLIDSGRVKATKKESLTSEMATRHVFEALRRNQPEGIELIYLPDVVRTLDRLVPVKRVHAVLKQLVERGVLELQTGERRLSDEDDALCPRGPRKTVFVWARWKAQQT